jgi:subtilisin family serine protease
MPAARASAKIDCVSMMGSSGSPATSALKLAQLTEVMSQNAGVREIRVAMIDGPVERDHPGFNGLDFREIASDLPVGCSASGSSACLHGTFIAGILFSDRESGAPGLCPGCTALLRPIFTESNVGADASPVATPDELADAIVDCVNAGTHILNLSLAVIWPSAKGEQALNSALDWAARNQVIVVAAAGNQATVGGSVITRHPWVIPVVACDDAGLPLSDATLAGSIGRRGLRAPGARITSLAPKGTTVTLSGTSVAAPFVTGAAALLWSSFPSATATQVKLALVGPGSRMRSSIVPPVLDASEAFGTLLPLRGRTAA